MRLDWAMTDANDEALLRRLVVALAPVPGVEAIALGGSRARGAATAQSDYSVPAPAGGLGRLEALIADTRVLIGR